MPPELRPGREREGCVTEAVGQDQPLLLRLLLSREALQEKQLREVPKALAQHPDSLEEAIVRYGLVEDTVVAEAYADYLSVPLIEASEELIERCREVSKLVPETTCHRRRVVPVALHEGVLELACLNPTDIMAQEEVQLLCGHVVKPAAAPLGLIETLLNELFGARDMVREIAGEEEEVDEQELAEADLEEEKEEVVDLERPVPPGKDGQIIRIVNLLLANAIRQGASDIHLEPYEETVRVRYRIDGKLQEVTPPPRGLFVPTISRLKVLSKMDIAERRIPQDGAIAARISNKRIDFRVSTVPTVYGEKMVLRILAKEATPEDLTMLGFSKRQADDFEKAANSPHGLMFVTGPTGSGKSTTLYTCLNIINRPHVNIVTVEDPVEYRFEGLNQSQVHSDVGMTFSKALRAFLRQDPDIIMLGEVRDQETADICLRAALTGHLVLSTLHTNDSLQAVNRLVDMGIEPFLLGPALRIVQAQRLARKLCTECRVSYTVSDNAADMYGIERGITLYRSGQESCGTCRGTGYKGRVGIFEVILITDEMRELIMSKAPLPRIYASAREAGMQFLADSAKEKVIAGITSIEEVADFLRPVEDVEDLEEAA